MVYEGEHAPINFYRFKDMIIYSGQLIVRFKLKIEDHSIEVDDLDTLKSKLDK